MTKKNNNRQDIAIARLEEKFSSLEKRFDNFINNHFESFKKEIKNEVLWVRRLVVVSILIPIFIFIITQLI